MDASRYFCGRRYSMKNSSVRRWIGILLVLCLTAVAFPQTAQAAEDYNLWIGGVQITSENKDDITAAINAVKLNAASGTATFDPVTNTLTVSDFHYVGSGYAFDLLGTPSEAAVYSGLDTLQITAINANSLSHTTSSSASYGIYTAGGLAITNDSSGSLTASSCAATERSIGIYVLDKDFTVHSGTVLGESGNAADISTGVWCLSGDITVHEAGELTGRGGNGNITRGICASRKLAVGGGTVKGNSGSGNSISHGISAGSLESSSGKSQVIGTASDANESAGIKIWNASVFSGGYVKGESLAGDNAKSHGVMAESKLTIDGGTMIAQGASGAFSKAPEIDPSYSGARVWYGDNETAADASGEKSAGDIAANYMQKYVRIICAGNSAGAPGDRSPEIPETGDSSRTGMWIGIMAVSALGLATTAGTRRRERAN